MSAPLTKFLNMATGDPNDTCVSRPHVDVIREALKAKTEDANASHEQREQARQMLHQLFPETPARESEYDN